MLWSGFLLRTLLLVQPAPPDNLWVLSNPGVLCTAVGPLAPYMDGTAAPALVLRVAWQIAALRGRAHTRFQLLICTKRDY